MDVRCSRCNTEYELDDARVGSSGTTVKCSTCGHVFKVMPAGLVAPPTPAPQPAVVVKEPSAPQTRPDAAPPKEPSGAQKKPDAPAEWMVKAASTGQTYRFRELTTLQKWIVERKVGRDDEISRTGKTWKRLGDIAELTSFFQVVEAADAAQRAVTQQQMPHIQLTASQTGTFQAISIPQPAPLPQPTEQVPAPPTIVPAPAATTQPPISLVPTAAKPAEPAPAPAKAAPEPELPDLPDLDDDDPVLAWQKRRKNMMAAGVGAVVLAAVAVIIGLAASSGGAPPLDPALVTRAAEAQRSVDDDAKAAVIAELAIQPKNDLADAWRARLLASRAQVLLEQNRLKELLSQVDTAAAALVPTTTAAEKHLAEATALVLGLRSKDTALPETDLAAAAISLAKGDVDAVAPDVGLAREHSKHHEDGPEKNAIESEARLLLTLAQATPVHDVGDVNDSLQKLELFSDARTKSAAAVVAAQLLLMQRTETAAPPAESIARAEAAIARLPDSDPRKALAAQVVKAAAKTPAPPTPTPTPPTTPEATPPTTPTTPTTPTPPTTPELPESFDALMQKAESAIVNEKYSTAYALLKKATSLKPASGRAWLKFGWACSGLGKFGEAARAFQKALDAESGLAEAQFGLAESLRFSGKKDEAIAAYKAYLAMDPSGKDANIAKNALKQLE